MKKVKKNKYFDICLLMYFAFLMSDLALEERNGVPDVEV